MTAILQWIYDVFTILTNFIVLISPYAIADVLLNIYNLFSIVFIMMVAYVLYDCLASKTKNPVIQTSYFAVLVTIMISAFLSLMLLLEVPFLPQITPSFTHKHYSNIVIKPNKKQIYTNKSNVQWRVIYNNGPFGYITTNEFSNDNILQSLSDDDWDFAILEGTKGDSTKHVEARLQKENVHIVKTENAKKYPDYVSYKITKIETKDGSLTKTAYHKMEKIKFKELYLEVIADVTPDRLKDAQQDEQDRKNQKDVDQLLNN